MSNHLRIVELEACLKRKEEYISKLEGQLEGVTELLRISRQSEREAWRYFPELTAEVAELRAARVKLSTLELALMALQPGAMPHPEHESLMRCAIEELKKDIANPCGYSY